MAGRPRKTDAANATPTTPKKKGFKVRADFFLEIDPKDFAKQSATYGMIAKIQASGELPSDFLATARLVSVDAKLGSADDVPPAPIETMETTSATD